MECRRDFEQQALGKVMCELHMEVFVATRTFFCSFDTTD